MPTSLSWVEIDRGAIKNNVCEFVRLLPENTTLLAVVKAMAYGHGLVEIARIALGAGAKWLGVFQLAEAIELRRACISAPILIMGYVPRDDLEQAVKFEFRITTSSLETIEQASRVAKKTGKHAYLHLKLECGTHRLGLEGESLKKALMLIRYDKGLELEGVCTHFANIEDTTEHEYALYQLERFQSMLAKIHAAGFCVRVPHIACTAAVLLFTETYFAMARVGIGIYGLWPSKETLLSVLKKYDHPPRLTPAMTWKTRVVQLKHVPKNAYIGYGCTYRTTRPTILAVLPVGYANGYDRLFSNQGYVLVHGVRAPIRGRVCMNLTMVDVTDIPQVKLEDEVVLLGKQGKETICAEQLAAWAQTISHEIIARLDPFAPRYYVNSAS